MDLIDGFICSLPSVCLITDDPYRVKMIAAHYLDNVELFTETRGQVGLIGKYKSIPLIVLSVGIGTTSTMAYITELCAKNQIKRIVYFGDCITNDSTLSVGSIIYISKAYENDQCYAVSENLYLNTEIILRANNNDAQSCVTTTYDRYLIERQYRTSPESKVLDFTTSELYKLGIESNIETISILNVCENVITHENIADAVRQSGCHTAVEAALSIAVFQSD